MFLCPRSCSNRVWYIILGSLEPLGSWILINVSLNLPIGERALIRARIKGQLKRTGDRLPSVDCKRIVACTALEVKPGSPPSA